MKTSTVTIKELSFLSGYSTSTVSKALNDRQDVSQQASLTIKKIAKRYNYRPNNYAVALRIKQYKSIAVILPDVTEPAYNSALNILQKLSDKLGYRVFLCQSFNSQQKEDDYLSTLNDGTIEGVILISNRQEIDKLNTERYSIPVQQILINLQHSTEDIKSASRIGFHKLIG